MFIINVKIYKIIFHLLTIKKEENNIAHNIENLFRLTARLTSIYILFYVKDIWSIFITSNICILFSLNAPLTFMYVL